MKMRILFVCLGNICRSPSAEGVFRAAARTAGLKVEADSAGTGDWHVGAPPYGPMQAAAAARGYDLSPLRARQVRRADFDDFDLIVGMDTDNIAALEQLRPAANDTPVVLFTDYVDSGEDHVPDPYFTRDFDGALDLIERASAGLVERLTARRG